MLAAKLASVEPRILNQVPERGFGPECGAFDPSAAAQGYFERGLEGFKGRAELIVYCERHGIPVTASAEKPYSMDRNLMHVSYEAGILEDPWAAPPEDIFLLTRSPENASDKAQEITISFEKGEPIAIDGEKYGPVDMLSKLLDQASVKIALERHDEVGKLGRRHPFPGVEFGVLGRNVDVAGSSQEAAQEPVLFLPAPLATPQFILELVGQIVAKLRPLLARRQPVVNEAIRLG